MSTRTFSVVLAAIDDYSIVEEVHRCLEGQTIRKALELILVCRTEQSLALPPGFQTTFPDVVIVEAGERALLNDAREVGVRRASTPYVLIIEDHCLPFPDCLQYLLSRLEEGWTAVGPGFVSGNTSSDVGIAANILTYGQWMGRREGGERRFVSGYNSAFTVAALLARGPRLTDDLIAPSTLQMSLRRQSHRFCFEPRARMAHWEASTYDGVRQILSGNGKGLGMLRARQWSVVEKTLASLLSPLLFTHRVVRAVGTCRRLQALTLPMFRHLVRLSLIWTSSELRGYWCTDRQSAIARVSEVERDRKRFVDAALEPIRDPC
jgi:hypothetical protein